MSLPSADSFSLIYLLKQYEAKAASGKVKEWQIWVKEAVGWAERFLRSPTVFVGLRKNAQPNLHATKHNISV